MITRVGMISSIAGMKRVANSTRAGMDSLPRMGPMMRPTNRSMPVQRPPPTMWKKSRAHSQFAAIAATSRISTAPMIGRPAGGTIVAGGSGLAPGPAAGGWRPARSRVLAPARFRAADMLAVCFRAAGLRGDDEQLPDWARFRRLVGGHDLGKRETALRQLRQHPLGERG